MNLDLTSLNHTIIKNIEKILTHFTLNYRISSNRIILSCPIHISDSPDSMNIYTVGDTQIGNFRCWTNCCEQTVGYGVFNLVRYLFDEQTKQKHSYEQVAEFIRSLTGEDIKTISDEEVARNKFSKFVSNRKTNITPTVTRDKVRINLNIPADYYIKRGFSKEILNRYDIGGCFKRNDELFMRTVVPVYNEEFKLIGRLGRSMNSQCIICEKYHEKNKGCPSNDLEKRWASKWINSKGFKTGECFYNLWYAAPFIRENQTAIIVESCGNILRMEESGIHNGLGLFGLELTSFKLDILNELGVMNLILALDNDNAGKEATYKIINQTSKYFNVRTVNIGKKDIGELTISETQEIFNSL